jgi:flagellar hook assembly protein FlgD
VTASAPPTISPNGDGIADSARLGWTSTETMSGFARLSHGSTVVRSWIVSRGTGGAVTWDGRNAAGSAVPDGTYTFSVVGRDAAGNRASAAVSLTVDRTLANPRWSQTLFFPEDGDALATMSRLAFDQSRTASVSAAIYSGTTRVRTIWLHRTLAAGSHSWRWDGRSDAGTIVPRGVYTLHLTATTALGTTTAAQSVRLDAFRVSPSASVVRAGQTLILTLTTAEPLVGAPSITFSQPGRVAVHRTATSLGGGRYRVAFVIGSGPSGTASFLIAGRDTGGGLNTTGGTVAVH